MSQRPPRLFSKRYEKAIFEKKLRPSFPARLRMRIWHVLRDFDDRVWVRRDPSDNWTDETSVLCSIIPVLKKHYGVSELQAFVDSQGKRAIVDLGGVPARSLPGRSYRVAAVPGCVKGLVRKE